MGLLLNTEDLFPESEQSNAVSGETSGTFKKNYDDVIQKHSYTWSSKFYGISNLYFYCVSKYLDGISSDKMIMKSEATRNFKLADGGSHELLISGYAVYSIDNRITTYTANHNWVSIQSNYDITDLTNNINNFIKNSNPMKGHNTMMSGYGEGIELSFIAVDNINEDSVILDKEIKDNIFDNTVFQLNNIKGGNGIILHGDPGVGKSLICSAVAKEANKTGITTITITNQPQFEFLIEVINIFFDKCIIFLEDIDSIAESRMHGNTQISSLLQFINGIGSMKSDVVFVATTNFLDLLDNAIKNRPVRFNRIIKLELPNEPLLKKLFELYVGKDLEHIYGSYCKKANLKLTGSHIKEISRTAELLSKKNNKTVPEVLVESIETVLNSFNTTIGGKFGFTE